MRAKSLAIRRRTAAFRLPYNFARALYGATKMDQEVVVLSSLSKPAKPKPPVKPEPPKGRSRAAAAGAAADSFGSADRHAGHTSRYA